MSRSEDLSSLVLETGWKLDKMKVDLSTQRFILRSIPDWYDRYKRGECGRLDYVKYCVNRKLKLEGY